MSISDYPFTQEAAEQVRKAGYSLDSLLEKTSFKSVRSRAAERVLGAIGGQIPDRRANSDAEALAELLSYPLARVIVSCLDDQHLQRRYALAEAKLAFSRMKDEKDALLQLARDLGLHPEGTEALRLHFAEYIRAAHRMHAPKWKLVNRDLCEGYLTVTREELMRLLEEVIRDKVQKGLPLDVDEKVCAKLTEYLDPLRSEMQKVNASQKADLGQVEQGAFPPCMRKMLSDVASGTNLAHSARFALVSFLLQINMGSEDVISLFNTSPDFDQERTRYQVEHIAGASGTKYRPPSCATMATYGNCPGEDELCRRIRHPLSYYERRVRFLGKEGRI
ncbi:MAG: DNA primase large subunit PriL [Methanosaeta sp. PtaU1.Bin060]|nr:MAG: DNA primase large subunit PriL [Methanosaeta sp. PtaU1.Bin060]